MTSPDNASRAEQAGGAAKPDGYPLPWCDKIGMPYWQINLIFCSTVDGWSGRQRGKTMVEIIPWIDHELATMEDQP